MGIQQKMLTVQRSSVAEYAMPIDYKKRKERKEKKFQIQDSELQFEIQSIQKRLKAEQIVSQTSSVHEIAS